MINKVILNSGDGAWIFKDLAENLASSLQVEISDIPGDYNYVLYWDESRIDELENKTFIDFKGIKLASDKRLLAEIFLKNKIDIPETYLLNTHQEVVNLIKNKPGEWCLKYPVGCGASGHRIIKDSKDIPTDWLKPYVVQKFIKLKKLQVFRLYCAGGILFGWNRRKYTSEDNRNPWVAHAQGAVYEILGKPPSKVEELAAKVFKTAFLFDSFGCVDFLQDNDGKWLVLEIGTDGIFNHVDRNIGNSDLEAEIERRIANAF